MIKKYTNRVAVMLSDEQLAFIEQYAAERYLNRAEAIRLIVDLKKREAKYEKDNNGRRRDSYDIHDHSKGLQENGN